MPAKDTTFIGHIPAPLARPEGQPPVVQGADGSWMLELARGADSGFAFAYERVGGIVCVTSQARLCHPPVHMLQPVTAIMREDDAGKLEA